MAAILSILVLLILLLIAQLWLKPFETGIENWLETFAVSALLIVHGAHQIEIIQASFGTESSAQDFLFVFNLVVFAIFVFFLLLPTWRGLYLALSSFFHRVERGVPTRRSYRDAMDEPAMSFRGDWTSSIAEPDLALDSSTSGSDDEFSSDPVGGPDTDTLLLS